MAGTVVDGEMNDDLKQAVAFAVAFLALCIGLSTCQIAETYNDSVRAQIKRDAK